MLKRQEVFFRQVVGTCDVATLVVSYAAAYGVRHYLLRPWYGALYDFSEYVWILWVLVPTWIFLLRRYGLYEPRSYGSYGEILRSLLKVQALGGLVLLSVMYLTRSAEVSRLLLQVFLVIGFLGLVIEKTGVKLALHRFRERRGIHPRNVLVVGTDSRAARYARLVRNNPHWGMELVGFLSAAANGISEFCGKPVFGGPREFSSVLGQQVVDEVVTVTGGSLGREARALAAACAERGITFRTMIQMPRTRVGRYHVEELGTGRYLVSVETIPQDLLRLFVKRLVDVCGAAVGLILCAVVYLWYWTRIRRESPGPILFRQTRVGQNGRLFTLYKFRTMYPDAETRLRELSASNEMTGCIFKIKDDPRVIPSGRALRSSHLDELPQFWNVLKGEMSLVGTRPPTPSEVNQYLPHHHRRLSMRPGITGLWQLNGNGAMSNFEEIVKLDCEYIDNWSPWLDCRVVMRTAVKMLRRNGW